jgi:hypothetical protein
MAKSIGQIAAQHLAGIEGGMAGAVADYRAGMDIRAACGLGDSWGDLPAGVEAREVEAEVAALVMAAAEPMDWSDADFAAYQAMLREEMRAAGEVAVAEVMGC